MAGFIFRDPVNPLNTFQALRTDDPAIPPGYVFCGSDGAMDVPQLFPETRAGVNSGGWPPYTGDPTQVAVNPLYPNGITTVVGNTPK